jgi:hypothetical protein
VLIHIGTNGYIYEKNMDKLMALLKDQERVVFVTIHADRRWAADNNTILRKTQEKHPNVVLVEWDAHASARRDLLVQDGIHLSGSGMQSYAQLLYAAFPAQAAPGAAAVQAASAAKPARAAASVPVAGSVLLLMSSAQRKKIPSTPLPNTAPNTALPTTQPAAPEPEGGKPAPQASITPAPSLPPKAAPTPSE